MKRLLAMAPIILLAACGDDDPVCTPGQSIACVGPAACSGFQVCNAEGSGYSGCQCSAPGDAGFTDSGADAGVDSGLDAGLDSGSDSGVDAGLDAGAADSGFVPCDPLSPACGVDEKCTYYRREDDAGGGVIACVATGTIAENQPCTEPTLGADHCAATLTCTDRLCRRLCNPELEGQCPDGNCSRYSGLFGDPPTAIGACAFSCDPVTQEIAAGGPCPLGDGCYTLTSQLTTIAICARPGNVGVGQPITGTPFANSCVPGAMPRRPDPGSTTFECGALCRPNDVWMGMNETDEGGQAPYTCGARGADGPEVPVTGESCRYWWSREPFTELSPFSNTIGWCFKHPAFQYDSDGDSIPDAPFPRCITLTDDDVLPPVNNPPQSDALAFWCKQIPPP